MSSYLFTNAKGKFIELKKFRGVYTGDLALKHRTKLAGKNPKRVIAWAHMGGDNPKI